MFRSYEDGRGGFVTIIANYNPLQDPFGGPNFFPLDADAVYDIHITNDGDAVEDITFRFQVFEGLEHEGFLGLLVGPPDNRQPIPIPFINIAPFGVDDTTLKANLKRDYYVRVIRGALDDPNRSLGFVTEARVGGDLAGFPNGRRPGDDVVDIALRALMGVLLPEADAPSGQLPFTDGARQHADQFDDTFPYLKTPIPGSRTD